MGRIGGLALILAACGGRSVSLDPFEVSGCPEGSGLRLLTYEPGTACDALDPTTDSTAPRTVPLDDALWSDREQEGPPRLRAPAESAVVEARCVDQDGVVDGWGCADERDGPLDLAVAPVCAPASCAGCDWFCPAGALPRWTGTELCVAECAPAQEEPAGTEQDPGTGQDPSGQDPNDPGGNGDPVPDDQPNPDGTDPTACGACNGTTCCDGACGSWIDSGGDAQPSVAGPSPAP